MHKSKSCPVCREPMSFYNKGKYYLEDSSLVATDFYYCTSCDCFARDTDDSQVKSHLKAASYTDLKNQDKFYQQRKGYFEYLFRFFIKNTMILPSSWLDFGSAYGHFVQSLNRKGVKSQGVELNSDLVSYCNASGRETFHGLESIPDSDRYTVISFIDSLYYSGNPRFVLQEAKKHLGNPGFLILRITNRNWLAHIRTKTIRMDLGYSLGDVSVGFSKSSIMRLLAEEGYEIVKLTSVERGKSLTVKTKAFYILTEALYRLTFSMVNICPGIIVIAKKNEGKN